MDTPTAATIRQHARPFDFATVGYPAPPPDSADPDPLTPRVASALAYVLDLTCRTLATLPVELEPLLLDALTMRVQQLALGNDARRLRQVALGGGIKSFRAGDYNETRFTPGEGLRPGERDTSRINPWTDLADLLLLLSTGSCRARLDELAGGTNAPAVHVQETVWDGGDGYGGIGGWF